MFVCLCNGTRKEHSSAVEDSGIWACDAVSLDEWLPYLKFG
jgi:bacterioferritin-associated ferredoxin